MKKINLYHMEKLSQWYKIFCKNYKAISPHTPLECEQRQNFKTTSKDKLEAIYNGYLDMRIPALQKMFEK